MTPPPRTPHQRKQDTLQRLEQDINAWVATADPASGVPYLVPLSFLWDGRTVLVATPASSPTGRNLQASGRVRLGIGPPRDVVMIEGTVQAVAATAITQEVGDAFAAKSGFDPPAERPLPLLPHSARTGPSLARGQRASGPRAHARRTVARAGLSRLPGGQDRRFLPTPAKDGPPDT
jgi:Pyridoxamine 5'-phosphate oxidase